MSGLGSKYLLERLKNLRYPHLFHDSRMVGIPVGSISGVALMTYFDVQVTENGRPYTRNPELFLTAAFYGAFAGMTWIEHAIACGVVGMIVRHKMRIAAARKEQTIRVKQEDSNK